MTTKGYERQLAPASGSPPPAVAEALARLREHDYGIANEFSVEWEEESEERYQADLAIVRSHIQAGAIGCPRHLGAPSGVCSHPDCMREHIQAGAGTIQHVCTHCGYVMVSQAVAAPDGERTRAIKECMATLCEGCREGWPAQSANHGGQIQWWHVVPESEREDSGPDVHCGGASLRALLPSAAPATETTQ